MIGCARAVPQESTDAWITQLRSGALTATAVDEPLQLYLRSINSQNCDLGCAPPFRLVCDWRACCCGASTPGVPTCASDAALPNCLPCLQSARGYV